MNTSGTSISLLSFAASSNTLSVVTPPESALILAACITGPSAVGSEKGIPSSMISAPATAIALTIASVVSRSGSPQVTKGIKALPFANASLILVIDILPSVACDCGTILVSASRDIYNHYLILVERRCKLHGIGNCMSRLYSRYYALCS